MSNLKITQTGKPYSQDVKRFSINDCKLTATCPECGKRVSRTLDDNHYLSYPDINVPITYDFYHDLEVVNPVSGETNYQQHEWSEQIVIRITVELVPNPTAGPDSEG